MSAFARPEGLAWSALGSRAAAAVVRWIAACACGFAGLLLVALSLAAVERTGAEPAQTSASAYLDFDLAVLRSLSDRSLRGEPGLEQIWLHRPDWQVHEPSAGQIHLASLRDAWAAASSSKSRFRTAARGALDALPFLLAGLALAFLAAAVAGALARVRRRGVRALAGVALVLVPLVPLLDPSIFYDRTRSLGTGLAGALFVAVFAGALSGAVSRALFAAHPQPAHLMALGGRKALLTAARLSALDAADWLAPLVPALAAAALFVCAKADQDPAARGQSSGFGTLIRSAMTEAFAGERLASCALVAAGLLLLWFLGHRFVLELRGALGARKALP